jgi:hypothetical protein
MPKGKTKASIIKLNKDLIFMIMTLLNSSAQKTLAFNSSEEQMVQPTSLRKSLSLKPEFSFHHMDQGLINTSLTS